MGSVLHVLKQEREKEIPKPQPPAPQPRQNRLVVVRNFYGDLGYSVQNVIHRKLKEAFPQEPWQVELEDTHSSRSEKAFLGILLEAYSGGRVRDKTATLNALKEFQETCFHAILCLVRITYHSKTGGPVVRLSEFPLSRIEGTEYLLSLQGPDPDQREYNKKELNKFVEALKPIVY